MVDPSMARKIAPPTSTSSCGALDMYIGMAGGGSKVMVTFSIVQLEVYTHSRDALPYHFSPCCFLVIWIA